MKHIYVCDEYECEPPLILRYTSISPYIRVNSIMKKSNIYSNYHACIPMILDHIPSSNILRYAAKLR